MSELLVLPHWNSIDAATVFREAFRAAGIVCLSIGVLLELIGFFTKVERPKRQLELWGIVFFVLLAGCEYGEWRFARRVDHLVQTMMDNGEAERQRLNQQVGTLEQTLRDTQAASDSIRQKLKSQEEVQAQAERLRRTPPEVDAFLLPTARGKVILQIVSANSIPFEFRYVIVTRNNQVAAGFPVEMAKVYPSKAEKQFQLPIDLQLDRVQDNYVELRFTFESIYAEELRIPAREIVRRYRLAPDQIALQPLE